MILLLSFCSIPWWLAWLLPFILGLLVGWAIWSRYKKQVEEKQEEISNLHQKISALERDLEECKRSRVEAKGRIAELEVELNAVREAAAKATTGTTGAAVGLMVEGLETEARGDEATGMGSTDIYAGLPSDNLQVIEGIGPKMESVLKENDIGSWSVLASMSAENIRNILSKYGNKYKKIVDPTSWPDQATLARDGKWEALIVMQKGLDGGKASSRGVDTDSKVEKMMIKLGLLTKYKQDDLKAIEGIGPKISELLHGAGITTWLALSHSTVSKLQEILDKAGSRYKLANPGTWPKQAELAAEGKWKELQAYQEELTGGR
jgi:predicted flap endonuclease-1-like 5' DNA nuclease